jgi:gluconokinase
MGVSGSGKTSVGIHLARLLGWDFFDGDDFHPPENVAKMASGAPLDDADRAVWLATLHDLIAENLLANKPLVVASSALKGVYRQQLLEGNANTVIVYLRGSFDLILNRMMARRDHYMKAEMLRSQFEALEEPTDVVAIDIDQDVNTITTLIINKLGLREKYESNS